MKTNKSQSKRVAPLCYSFISMLFCLFFFSMALIFLSSNSAFSSALSLNVSMNNTQSDSPLVCSWQDSADTLQANISWFNGTVYYNYAGVSSPQIIAASYTTRGQTWICNIFVSNATHTINLSKTALIENSPPTSPAIINSSGAVIQNVSYLYEDSVYMFTLNASDADDDEISFFIISGRPANSSFSSAGSFNWTPTHVQDGSNNVTFMASDGYSGSRYKKINFIVLLVNDPPYFNPALTNKVATEGQPFSYTITGADEEGDYPLIFRMRSLLGQRLKITNTSSTTAIIQFNTTSGKPEFSDRGNYTVNVTMNDTRNGSTFSLFNLEVRPVNHLPNMTFIHTQTGIQGNPFLLGINATDMDNDTLIFGINESVYTNGTPIAGLSPAFYRITTANQPAGNASGLINLTVILNEHVVRRNARIIAYDSKQYSYQDVLFNFTNINDAPQIFEISYYENNSYNLSNMSNLTAYADAPFIFKLNATDVDSRTYQGESINFSIHASAYLNSRLNKTTGILLFTPNSSMIGSYTVTAIVTDDDGLSDNMTLNLAILANTAPYFEHNMSNLTCYEDNPCTYDVNASDPDFGDYINYSASRDFVVINRTGFINFTPDVTMIGNFSTNITITDSRGAFNSSVLNIRVLNVNDAPVLQNITFPDPVVESHAVVVYANVFDEDLHYNTSDENLTFELNISGPNTNLFTISKVNSTTGLIFFTPDENDTGSYELNISVMDLNGSLDYAEISIFIFNQSDPPLIVNITPWGLPKSAVTYFNYTLNTFRNSSAVSIDENTTVLFNHTTTDDDTAPENLSISWYFNMSNETLEFVSSNWSFSRNFNFFSNGTYFARLIIFDDYYENATFQWNITINNINRPPRLLHELLDITVGGSDTAFNNYFSYYNSATRFIDPDDDLDSDNFLDANETNTMNFTAETCEHADIVISGANIQISPLSQGDCQVYFNATDSVGAVVLSNQVLINITEDPDNPNEVVTTRTTGGGSTRTLEVPVPEEVEVPRPLRIIAPKVLTIYTNQTMEVPITLENNWTSDLNEIMLSADTNVSNVSFRFTRDYWPVIELGTSRETTLVVSNYRTTGTYEIMLKANIANPQFEDSVLLVVNSIESLLEGEKIKQKVTFARDLLNDNPECQELNELLDRAEQSLAAGDLQKALKTVDSVINGCKYIVNNIKDRPEENPKPILERLSNLSRDEYIIIGSVLIVIVGLSLSWLILKRAK
ncbi:MAG: Ig-like domain-containing protein [Candidatus Woesearchaeota archaeon]